jgi:hypothetical protein
MGAVEVKVGKIREGLPERDEEATNINVVAVVAKRLT